MENSTNSTKNGQLLCSAYRCLMGDASAAERQQVIDAIRQDLERTESGRQFVAEIGGRSERTERARRETVGA